MTRSFGRRLTTAAFDEKKTRKEHGSAPSDPDSEFKLRRQLKRRGGSIFTFDIIQEIGCQNFLLDPIDARRLGFPYGGFMDVRKLVLGLTALAIVAGLLLVCFAPGGWFNKGKTERAEVKTPIGSLEFSTRESKSSNWPTVGYVLLGAGGIGVVAFVSMKSPQR